MTILRPFFLLALVPLIILNSSCSDDRLNFQALCGNGIIETGEECDEGANGTESGLCTPHCLKAFCGDGFLQAGFEICDDAQLNSDTLPNHCRSNCTPARCGDGTLDEGEQCDNGADNTNSGTNTCRLNCLVAYCGDGVVDAGEQCDDGNLNDTDNCTHFCLPPHCGDGFVHSGTEECDQGGLNSDLVPDGCRSNCTSAFCGDGVTDSNEDCDPLDSGSNLNCTSTCDLCNVSLLLPFDRLTDSEGEDTPNRFEDYSGNDLTPIAKETPLGHGLPYTDIHYYVNGTGSVHFPWVGYLEIPQSERLQEAMNFGSRDFTIEFFKFSGHAADSSYDLGIMGCGGAWDFYIGRTTAYFRSFTWHYVQPLDVWQHVAIVRHDHLWSLYVDGVALAKAGTQNDEEPIYHFFDNTPVSPCTGNFVLGQNTALNRSWWKGKMDDLRITKGEARYTENFTPPTSTLLGCE